MSRIIAIGLAFFVAALGTPACRADESVLDEVFTCDLRADDEQCGTDENGEPMTCYVGSAQLGGKAFCAKRCDPERHPENDAEFACTRSGALLERCDPGEPNACPKGLNCYRTDLVFDEGLCLWVPICPYANDGSTELDSAGCPFGHQKCAGDVLRELSPSTALRTNNLHCVVEPPCTTQGCPTEPLLEVCPSAFYNPYPDLPVTCAVQCDEFTCPPNFTCAETQADLGSPLLCLPGVPGARCTSRDDCLTGECIDTGAGFSACTNAVPCESHADCVFAGLIASFACLEGGPTGEAHCFSPIPFSGTNCEDDDECAGELDCGGEKCPPRVCSWKSVIDPTPDHGECRFECDEAVGCPAFGGMPHVCLDGSCAPCTFGVPCSSSSECFAELVCGKVPPDARSLVGHPEICTIPCSDDADCARGTNPWVGGGGYCVDSSEPVSGSTGFCRPGAAPDMPCEKDAHCISPRGCLPDGVCASD